MNNITTKGNIGSDPEIKFAKDLAIASFSVAHTPRKKNKVTQNWEDGETMWYRVTFFGSKAEGIVDNYAKGDTVILVGMLAQSTYTNKEGKTVTGLEITGTEIAKIAKTQAAKTKYIEEKVEAPGW
jgi:single-strand DNA-binding protein